VPELIRSPYLLGVAAWVSLLSFGATIVYFEQAHIVSGLSKKSVVIYLLDQEVRHIGT
jgi:hypothetical protein